MLGEIKALSASEPVYRAYRSCIRGWVGGSFHCKSGSLSNSIICRRTTGCLQMMSCSLKRSSRFCYVVLGLRAALSLALCHINNGPSLGVPSNSHLTPLELDLLNPTMIAGHVVNHQQPHNANLGISELHILCCRDIKRDI